MSEPVPLLDCPCCDKKYSKKNKPCACLSCSCQCCTTCINEKGMCCKCEEKET